MVEWAKTVSTDEATIKAVKEGKVSVDAYEPLRFHLQRWDAYQSTLEQFEKDEVRRKENHASQQSYRLAEARSAMFAHLMIAGGALATFILVAMILIMAKIENHLRSLNVVRVDSA